MLVRISSLFATLSELACLANPLDCHVRLQKAMSVASEVTYSTYSLSLALATAVGGWDPDHLAEVKPKRAFEKAQLRTGICSRSAS